MAWKTKNIVINASGAGDAELHAAVTGYRIRVLSYVITPNGAGTVRFESGAGGTALTGIMDAAAAQPIAAAYSPVGHFETAKGAALSLEIGSTIDVDGHATIELVPAN